MTISPISHGNCKAVAVLTCFRHLHGHRSQVPLRFWEHGARRLTPLRAACDQLVALTSRRLLVPEECPREVTLFNRMWASGQRKLSRQGRDLCLTFTLRVRSVQIPSFSRCSRARDRLALLLIEVFSLDFSRPAPMGSGVPS